MPKAILCTVCLFLCPPPSPSSSPSQASAFGSSTPSLTWLSLRTYGISSRSRDNFTHVLSFYDRFMVGL